MHLRTPVLYAAFGGVFTSAGVGIIVDALVALLPFWWLFVGIFALIAGAVLVVGALVPIGLPGTPSRTERGTPESLIG